MYLYGKNSVLERLKANPSSIKKVFLQDKFSADHILSLIEQNNVPIQHVREKEILRIKRADRLQGIVAEIEKFSYTPFEDLIHRALEENISLLFLDNINDPHNLGSIIRICACFGGFAIVIPRHASCEVTDAVMHVSSGGENFVPVSMVSNMSTGILKAKSAGFWVAGTVIDGGEDMGQASLPQPLSLVLGSEGKGIRHGIDKHLDVRVTLPMRGVALSFNVAMASAIFCYEIQRQRSKSKGQAG